MTILGILLAMGNPPHFGMTTGLVWYNSSKFGFYALPRRKRGLIAEIWNSDDSSWDLS